jgi:ABC-type nitrate/sulfonate/bicarbonate transport system ATPase subunit
MHGHDFPSERALNLLAEAGLASLAHRRVALFSQGLRRRLAIIRAVVHEPALILLDEPFASLDTVGTQWLECRFEAWRIARRSVCFASHDLELSRRVADRIIWLDAGRIAAIEHSSCHFSSMSKIA